jgi:hypothetical protein
MLISIGDFARRSLTLGAFTLGLAALACGSEDDKKRAMRNEAGAAGEAGAQPIDEPDAGGAGGMPNTMPEAGAPAAGGNPHLAEGGAGGEPAVPIEGCEIPDAALLAAVRAATDVPEGTIPPADLAKLTKLFDPAGGAGQAFGAQLGQQQGERHFAAR